MKIFSFAEWMKYDDEKLAALYEKYILLFPWEVPSAVIAVPKKLLEPYKEKP